MKYKIPPHLRFCRPSPELRTFSCYSLKLLFCRCLFCVVIFFFSFCVFADMEQLGICGGGYGNTLFFQFQVLNI